MKTIYFTVIVLSLMDMTFAQLDTSVCTPLPSTTTSAPNTPKRPTIPDKFAARIECNMINENLTTDIEEWFDTIGNRGAVHQWMNGVEVVGIYSFNTNELLMFAPSTDGNTQCFVHDLSQSGDRFLFGEKTVSGKDRIYTAAGAFQFGGNTTEVYMNRTTIRGILTDSWQSCEYVPVVNATVMVVWYFTAPSWTDSAGVPQIPVRCHVKGKVQATPTYSRSFEHIYEFTEFRLDYSPSVFETPRGTFCPGRKITKTPPKLPSQFSFSAETMTPETRDVSYVKETFDYKTKIVQIDHQPSLLLNMADESHMIREVHDFNTGVAYIQDTEERTCKVQPLKAGGFDAEPLATSSTGKKLVRIRTGFEFVFTNSSKNITYCGMRVIRGIECDCWIAVKDDYPITDPVNSTWEFYFARPEWVANAGLGRQSSQLIMMDIYLKGNMHVHLMYNVYDYSEEEPDTFRYDISLCYPPENTTLIRFLIPGSYQKLVLQNEELFKTAVLSTIRKTVAISPVRVSNLNLDYSDNHTLVSFSLLDVAPIKGNVPNPPQEIPLKSAATTLNHAFATGQFNVVVDKQTFKAIPYSDAKWGLHMVQIVTLGPSSDDVEKSELEPEPEPEVDALYHRYKRNIDLPLTLCSQQSEGFSSGALGGVAAGMLVLGFLVVFIGMLLGGKFGGSRMSGFISYEMS